MSLSGAALAGVQRTPLPSPKDRYRLGTTGLEVSPICIGITGKPEIIPEAFDAGINFFFLTADLHWPLYEGLRRGLEILLARGGGIREDIVVAGVSYLEQPMFGYLQLNEIIGAVAGLDRVDIILAGAVSGAESFNARYPSLFAGRSAGRHGARGIGASFHDRATALACLNANLLDVEFIRYNTAHPGARSDIFRFARSDRWARVYNFTSTMAAVSEAHLRLVGMSASSLPWLPSITDYYRFALSNGVVDGLLTAPREVHHVSALDEGLRRGALTEEEQEYMMSISSALTPKHFG